MKYSFFLKSFTLAFVVFILNISILPPEIAHASYTTDSAKACLKSAAAGGIMETLGQALQTALSTLSGTETATSVPTSNEVLQETSIAQTIFQKFTKGFEDCIFYAAGQYALNNLNRNTIDWVRKGFGGNPLFATKPFQIYIDTSNAVAGGFSSQFGKIPVTEFVPGYQQRVQNQISLSTRQDSSKKYEQSIKSTLPEGVVPQDFYHDFNAGGWDAYMSSLYDNNNGFGVELLTSQELDARQQEAYNIQQQKLAWSGGFKDLIDPEKCFYPPEIQDIIDSSDPATQIDPAELQAVQMMYCQIATPGKVIGEQTTATVNSDIQRYGFIDTLSKLVDNFIKQMSTKATRGIFRDYRDY